MTLFQHSLVLFYTRRKLQYLSKLRKRYPVAPSLRLPLAQTKAQRDQTIQSILRAKNKISSCSALLASPSAYRDKKLQMERRLYSLGARLEREENASLLSSSSHDVSKHVNATYALQGLGDLEPLRNSKSFGFSEREALKFSSPQEAMKYVPPPVPFTPLTARKMAEGNLWPQAPDPTEMRGVTAVELRYLRHRDNMSPSAKHFSDKLLYHLRRNLKACPAHLAERIDFAQLILQEVICSRRSKRIYIIWSTVDPGARWELEPHLIRLHYWVRRIVLEKMKTRPNLPEAVHWVYDGGRIERELPSSLKREIRNVVGDVTASVDTRVQYLKALDSVQQRMKDVPWFMPYLWNKEEKAAKEKQMRSDVEEYQRRRREAKAREQEAVAQVDRLRMGSGRGKTSGNGSGGLQPAPLYVR